jgi:thiol-disulfide isomerase/thioredoxin
LGQSLWVAAIVVMTIAGGAFVSRSRLHLPARSTDVSERVLSLSLEDHFGVWQPFAQWRGKVLVVNFWATWCPPCIEEMSAFSRLSREWAAKGVQFVGIGVDHADKIREFAKGKEVAYPLLIGTPEMMETAVNMGNSARGLPFTVVIDSNGHLRRAHLGRLAESELALILSSIL